MVREFDYYDLIGTFATGVATVGAGYLVYLAGHPDTGSAAMGGVFHVSLGSSILIIIGSFIIGEIVNAVAKVIDKIVWRFCGGKPVTWIAKKEDGSLLKPDHGLVGAEDASTIRRWVNQCCKGDGSDICSAEDIVHSLHRLELKAYQMPANKKLIMNMLAKSTMFRGFMVVSVALCISSLVLMWMGGAEQVFYENKEKEIHIILKYNWFGFSLLNGMLLFGSIGLLPVFLWRYMHYCRLYAKDLFSSFLEVYTSKEASATPADAGSSSGGGSPQADKGAASSAPGAGMRADPPQKQAYENSESALPPAQSAGLPESADAGEASE